MVEFTIFSNSVSTSVHLHCDIGNTYVNSIRAPYPAAVLVWLPLKDKILNALHMTIIIAILYSAVNHMPSITRKC